MRLKHYDNLRNFVIAARHSSLASAAEELCLTKGALSHQIRNLEDDLGFALFERHSRGVRLSQKGEALLTACRSAFDQIERKADELGDASEQTLTIGTTTYFASRWLSPRLMDFIRQHPDIRLRIQPMIELFDLEKQGVDLAIRWGDGRWTDCEIEKLFDCPAWPTGNKEAKERVERDGLETAFSSFTLLRDREDSDAWSQWYERAGLTPTRPHRHADRARPQRAGSGRAGRSGRCPQRRPGAAGNQRWRAVSAERVRVGRLWLLSGLSGTGGRERMRRSVCRMDQIDRVNPIEAVSEDDRVPAAGSNSRRCGFFLQMAALDPDLCAIRPGNGFRSAALRKPQP